MKTLFSNKSAIEQKKLNVVGGFFVFTFYVILFFAFKDDPFFGDAISTVSRAARHIYDSHFTSIAYPPGLDPGHPITFPLLYACLWKMFGLQLPVSHLVNLIFSLGIVFYVWKWVKRELTSVHAWVACLLLLCTPLFISQSVQMNTHLPLTFFTLGFAYSLRFDQKSGQILFPILMLLTHLQALYFVAPLWLWWFFQHSEKSVQARVTYMGKMLVLPLSIFAAWLLYHHSIEGWYLSSPTYSGHRGMPSFKRILINLVLADWRISDYGQIALFIIPVFVVFRRDFRGRWNNPLVFFLAVYFFNAIALAVTTQTGPAHRYLLACVPFLILANAYMFERVKRRVWIVVIPILLSGHFWFYPGKVMGDATLAFRDVFPLLEQIDKAFEGQVMHSYAPLSNPGKFTHLNDDSTSRMALYDIDINTVNYILRSNISGDFKEEELKRLRDTWSVKTYESGNVYVEVYVHPDIKGMQSTKRKIGRLERWMLILKEAIKGKDSH